MSFCIDCGKFFHSGDDRHCAYCGSPIEKVEGGRFTERQIESLNDPIVREELCNTETGRWMLKEAAKEGLIKDPRIAKFLLEFHF